MREYPRITSRWCVLPQLLFIIIFYYVLLLCHLSLLSYNFFLKTIPYFIIIHYYIWPLCTPNVHALHQEEIEKHQDSEGKGLKRRRI